MIEQWLPLAMSLVALVCWLLVVGGVVRRSQRVSSHVCAAVFVAILSAALAYLVASPLYFVPGWGPIARSAANVERTVLAVTGLYALLAFLCSAPRRERQQQDQPE